MKITVIATGGTIAGTGEALAPSVDAATLLAGLVPDGVEIAVNQVLSIDSSAMGAAEMRIVSDAVEDALTARADGVVVLHGTDTMAETALLVDLRLGILGAGPAVVFTGAMRGADDPEPDGPANIRGAIEAVRSSAGVAIYFAGDVLPVWGTDKAHTTELQPFRVEPAEAVRTAALDVLDFESRNAAAGPEPARVDVARVDVVALYPGADRVAIDAFVAAGARGLVLAGMGAGNANPAVVAAVHDAVAAGVVVAVSTRVAHGPVFPGYGGGGGGADLVTAGALISATLRPGQTRILLAELLAAGATREQISAVLRPAILDIAGQSAT